MKPPFPCAGCAANAADRVQRVSCFQAVTGEAIGCANLAADAPKPAVIPRRADMAKACMTHPRQFRLGARHPNAADVANRGDNEIVNDFEGKPVKI